MPFELPIISQASLVEKNRHNLLIIDLSQPASYVQEHIPGAVFLDYNWIVSSQPPCMGLLPTEQQLQNVFSAMGLTEETHVVVYDDEGGGRACRLLWTFDCIGHSHYSLLDGGLAAWRKAGYNTENHINWPEPAEYKVTVNDTPVATREYILQHLSDDNIAIHDARSPAEFNAQKVFANRGGHIPGAINIEWTETMQKDNDRRLKSEAELREIFESRGITRDKSIITHCQTHHRSAHSYIVLKSLGYDVKGYPGSWSDWGNQPDTPVV